jgi:two-component system phosphate regulon sensor histidine kinase PhoR
VFVVVTTCILLAGLLAAVLFSDIEGGPSLQRGTLFILFALMIPGVLLLGLDWFRLKFSFASLIKRMNQNIKSPSSSQLKDNPFKMTIGCRLNESFDKFFEQYEENTFKLHEQVNDMSVQVQLAQKQKVNTEAIIYSLRDAVIVVDEFNKLLMANEAAGKLFSFDHRSSQRMELDSLLSADNREFVELLRKCRQSKVEHKKKEIEVHIEGQQRFYDCIISCVRDGEGHICGVASVLHDVTREKEISKMKNDFVSHVSHELKTPLASITAYSEMLVDGEAKDEEMQKEFYSVIQNQAERLNRLIENILNISRIESGLIKVEKIPVSLTILIEEQFQMIKSYAEEKNIKVSGQKPIILDQVYVDKDMITQVLINLLSNAIKYTPSGGSVEIGTEVDENAGVVRVTISDTGAGIPVEDIDHIFDKFYRVGANKDKAKGTGLGLNLVKQIVEKVHGGKVFVESETGVGSTFGFELPLARTNVLESV